MSFGLLYRCNILAGRAILAAQRKKPRPRPGLRSMREVQRPTSLNRSRPYPHLGERLTSKKTGDISTTCRNRRSDILLL
jgi:hypothetical protein